jgi:cation diffusion facilitator family transporter
MSTEGSTKAVVAALLANSGIAVTKFVAFLLTGASSMLAEAIHSVADSGNQGLLLLGGRQAKRRPTDEHPFGYGRERYVYSFIVSIVLFSVGGLFALYEAYHKGHELHAAHGHPDNSLLDSRWAWVPIVVLLAAIVMESLSFRTAIRETGQIKGDASYVEFVRRAKQPELPVILLEDFAALCGLVFALLGVGLSLLTDNLWFDVIGTGLIGLLLVAVAIILAIETKSLLIGESASDDRVVHLKTMHLGPDELLVAAKIAVPAAVSAAEVAVTIDAAEVSIRAAEPIARVIYLEPDIARAAARPT